MELAQIEDPGIVGQAVANVLGVPDTPGQDAAEAVASYLGEHQVLVVLDNCEHLAGATAGLTEYLLAACPALTVLATSREALGVEGELNWQVPPLSLPDAGPKPTASALAASDAVKLFEQRAQLVLPSFRVTDDNAESSALLAYWPGRTRHADHDVQGILSCFMALRLPLSVRIATVPETSDLALVICERRVAGTSPDGERIRFSGRGCAVVRPQRDGAWRIAADAWEAGPELSAECWLSRWPDGCTTARSD